MQTKPSKHIETQITDRSHLNAEQWDAFIAASPQGANYARSWYLDVVWPGWQGIHVFHKNELSAVMPLRVSSKYGIRYCYQPALSQYGGVFFKKIAGKPEQVFAIKKRLVSAVVEAIPPEFRRFSINFAPEFDYPLPFHWAGYELRTRFTYWLHNSEDKEKLFRNCNERTRTYINKARKSGLSAHKVTDASNIIQLSQERDAYALDYGLLSRLWGALRANGAGHAMEVRDGEGHLHAGLIYQRSGDKLQHLVSAIDPELRSGGGMSLAIWHSIEQAGPEVRTIDFEGSMLEPVEHFFRGFGTHPVPYLQVRRDAFPRWAKLVVGKW